MMKLFARPPGITAPLSIYDLTNEADELVGFEFPRIGRRLACDIAARVPGAQIVRASTGLLAWLGDDDEFCELMVDGVRIIIGTSTEVQSRFVIFARPLRPCEQLQRVREVFAQSHVPLRKLGGFDPDDLPQEVARSVRSRLVRALLYLVLNAGVGMGLVLGADGMFLTLAGWALILNSIEAVIELGQWGWVERHRIRGRRRASELPAA